MAKAKKKAKPKKPKDYYRATAFVGEWGDLKWQVDHITFQKDFDDEDEFFESSDICGTAHSLEYAKALVEHLKQTPVVIS